MRFLGRPIVKSLDPSQKKVLDTTTAVEAKAAAASSLPFVIKRILSPSIPVRIKSLAFNLIRCIRFAFGLHAPRK